MKSRIFIKLLAAFALVIAAATVTLDFTVRAAWERSLRSEIERGLTQNTRLFAHSVENDKQHSLQQIAIQEGRAAEARATIVDSTGKVLADSEADPATMENHSTRPEFAHALSGGLGTDTRASHTLGIQFLYVATPIPGGAVRLAYPLSAIQEANKQVRKRMLEASALAFLVAIFLAGIATQSISRRLRAIVSFSERVAQGDLSARIAESGSDEIGQVAAALDRTARTLEKSFAAVQTSRKELETLLNSMREAVIALSSDCRVQWANARMNRLVPQGVRLDMPMEETLRDPDFLSAVREVLELKVTRTARLNSAVPNRTFNATVAPMPDGGAVAVLYDLTKVERVEKTRRDFIANVSHELRTPLTSIQGYTETLLDANSIPEPGREFLEIIRKNAARMSRLTEDLLTLARVESREHHFEYRRVTPEELLQDAVQSCCDLARSADVVLEIDNQATEAVTADPDAMHQVFANLVDNAIKYASDGKRVILGARNAGATVEFYVKDFGAGIASEHLSRIFERFYRVDKARSRESGGTGLGLAIAKHIVLAHGGHIRVESDLNHGSTFLFTLPNATVPAEAVKD